MKYRFEEITQDVAQKDKEMENIKEVKSYGE